TFNGTIPQALAMMNGDLTKEITSPDVMKNLMAVYQGKELVDYLYMAAFARKPTSADWGIISGAMSAGAYPDIWWALINSNELIPNRAKLGDKFSIVRSMSTREADHQRGRYYMHTGFVPNPNIEHPSYGAVVAHETENQWKYNKLEIPPFVSIGNGSVGPGY